MEKVLFYAIQNDSRANIATQMLDASYREPMLSHILTKIVKLKVTR